MIILLRPWSFVLTSEIRIKNYNTVIIKFSGVNVNLKNTNVLTNYLEFNKRVEPSIIKSTKNVYNGGGFCSLGYTHQHNIKKL